MIIKKGVIDNDKLLVYVYVDGMPMGLQERLDIITTPAGSESNRERGMFPIETISTETGVRATIWRNETGSLRNAVIYNMK